MSDTNQTFLPAYSFTEWTRLVAMAGALSGVGVWRMSLPDRTLFWSRQLYTIHGLDPADGPPDVDKALGFYDAEDRSRIVELLDRAINEGAPYEYRVRLRRADGEVRTVVSKADCDRGPDGRVTAVFGVFQDVTDQVRAVETAREEARRAAVAEELAGLGHWRVEFPSRELIWSPQMYRIYGLDPGTPISIYSVLAMSHPDDRDLTRERLEADLRGEPAEQGPVVRIVRPSGEIRWILGRSTVERHADGSIAALIGALMDVTDQTLGERARAESEARYRLLADNSTDVIITIGPDYRIRYASPSCRAFGYSPGELIGRETASLVHPEDRGHALGVTRVILQGDPRHRTARIEYRLQRKSGDYVWVEDSPTLIRGDDQGSPEVLSVLRDVGGRRAMEDALVESRARYRLLAENASDVVAQMNTAGMLTYISPAVTALTGYAVDEVLGRSAMEFIAPADRAHVRRAYERAMRGETVGSLDCRLTRKDGKVIWVESRPSAFRSAETGRIQGVTDVVREITARKEMERQLVTARAEAEAAAAVKSEFLANMSHELRTPLTSILGFAGLLAPRLQGDGTSKNFLDRIIRASEALLNTINDVLDFSKLEAGRVQIEPREVSIDAAFRDSVLLLAPQAAAKSIGLTFEREAGLPDRILIDDARVAQVILNLVGNAVKFTERGQVSVRLKASDGGRTLRLEIADTGVGIPEDRLNRLFQRFSQVDASTTRIHGGTGLGLAICKGLVEAMGGVIGVNSKVGEGSTFWFELPLTDAPKDLEAAAPPRRVTDHPRAASKA